MALEPVAQQPDHAVQCVAPAWGGVIGIIGVRDGPDLRTGINIARTAAIAHSRTFPIAADTPCGHHAQHAQHRAGQERHRMSHGHQQTAQRPACQRDRRIPGVIQRHRVRQLLIRHHATQHGIRRILQQAIAHRKQHDDTQQRDRKHVGIRSAECRSVCPVNPMAARLRRIAEQHHRCRRHRREHHTGRTPDQHERTAIIPVLNHAAGKAQHRLHHHADAFRRGGGGRGSCRGEHHQRHRERDQAGTDRTGRVRSQPPSVISSPP